MLPSAYLINFGWGFIILGGSSHQVEWTSISLSWRLEPPRRIARIRAKKNWRLEFSGRGSFRARNRHLKPRHSRFPANRSGCPFKLFDRSWKLEKMNFIPHSYRLLGSHGRCLLLSERRRCQIQNNIFRQNTKLLYDTSYILYLQMVYFPRLCADLILKQF